MSTPSDEQLSGPSNSDLLKVRPPSSMTNSSLPKRHSRTSSFSSITSDKIMSATKSVPVSTEILNPNSDDLTVGDCICVNGTKSGIIKFLGSTSFAPGKWAGVELADASEPKHGLFVRPHRLTLDPITPPEKPSSTVTSPSPISDGFKSSTNLITSVTSTTFASSRITSSSASNLKVGDKVMVINCIESIRTFVYNLIIEEKFTEIGDFKRTIKEVEEQSKSRLEEIRSLEEQIADQIKRNTDEKNHLIQMNEDLKNN
uniref:CAP-Gly domain-containing protein n=1 Tax=Tetranychus urticae TaxID=32264 RepID=T1L5F5_TETUR